jgi:hypothetical protein
MISDFNHYANWVKSIAQASEHPFVRDSEKMMKFFLDWEKALPSEYRWRMTTENEFKNQVDKAKGAAAINRVYWHDMARNLEAYGIMLAWRGSEVLRAAVRALNMKELINAATLVRSGLELGATAIENGNHIHSAVLDLPKTTPQTIITCPWLEKEIVRIIWGTRIDNPPEYLRQKNIMTTIQRLSRNPQASELLPTYEYLCELAHPNAVGNARYWSHVEKHNDDGSDTILMERDGVPESKTETVEKVLWAHGWSGVCVRNGRELIQDAVALILERWPRETA